MEQIANPGGLQTVKMNQLKFGINKKRFFRNNLHHSQQVLLYGTDYEKQFISYDSQGNPIIQNDYQYALEQAKNTNLYVSDYRRNQELMFRAKMEQDRIEQQYRQAALAKGIVPIECTSLPKRKKQLFLQGNYQKPHEIWAHDDGGLRKSELNNQEPQLTHQQQNQISVSIQDNKDDLKNYVEIPIENYKNNQPQQSQQKNQNSNIVNQNNNLQHIPDQQIYQYSDHYSSPQKHFNPIMPVSRYYQSIKPPLYIQHQLQGSQVMPPYMTQDFSLKQNINYTPGQSSQEPGRLVNQQEAQSNLPSDQLMQQHISSTPNLKTYQLEPHNFSVEQMRYLDRIKRLSEKQKKVYQMNILKHDFVSEKEKYARHIEKGVMVHLPINTSTTPQSQMTKGRRIPLGKLVNQVEMRNPEARKNLKDMLELQLKEKELTRQLNNNTESLADNHQWRSNMFKSQSANLIHPVQIYPQINSASALDNQTTGLRSEQIQYQAGYNGDASKNQFGVASSSKAASNQRVLPN